MAATLTVSTGLTSMPMFAHNVKAESKAETISSDTNDMSQYKKINGISSQTVLGADFSHYQLQKNAWKKKKSGKITKESKFPMCLNM